MTTNSIISLEIGRRFPRQHKVANSRIWLHLSLDRDEPRLKRNYY